jgi:adenylylsulfate kinase
MIIWLTGQPGSGKSTIANELVSDSTGTFINIDGDDLREIFQNKDYSEAGRRRNIELAQNLALFLHKKKYSQYIILKTYIYSIKVFYIYNWKNFS